MRRKHVNLINLLTSCATPATKETKRMIKPATYTSTHTFHSLTRQNLLVIRDLSDVELSKGWCTKTTALEKICFQSCMIS